MSAWWRRRLDGDAGLSLVEIIIAAFVLTVAILGLASAAISALRGLSDAQMRQQATALAAESLEVARSYDFDDLAMRDGDSSVPSPGAAFDPLEGAIDDLDPAGEGEDLLIDGDGAVRWQDGSPHLEEGTFELRTYVTEPDDHDGVLRVTALVEYTVPGGGREVRFSTFIADAERGVEPGGS